MKSQKESSEKNNAMGLCNKCKEAFNFIVRDRCNVCYANGAKNIDAQLKEYDEAMVKKSLEKDIS